MNGREPLERCPYCGHPYYQPPRALGHCHTCTLLGSHP